MLRYRKFFYIFSGTLAVVGIATLAIFGLPLSHEFTGGSLLEVEFAAGRPSAEGMRAALGDLHLGALTIQPSGERAALLKFTSVDEARHRAVVEKLSQASGGGLTERRFETIGPTLGKELRVKSVLALGLSLAGIFVYLVAAFRQSGGRYRPTTLAAIGVVTLWHDVVISAGLLGLASVFMTLEIGAPVIAAFLVIVGYSINDTIIVFDRIRETLRYTRTNDIAATIDQAIAATLRRSVFTSLTTLLAIVALFFFGGETLRAFALTLVAGIVIGTYSSICIASPLLYDLTPRRY